MRLNFKYLSVKYSTENVMSQRVQKSPKVKMLPGYFLNVYSLHTYPHCNWTVVKHAVGIRAQMSECIVLASLSCECKHLNPA